MRTMLRMAAVAVSALLLSGAAATAVAEESATNHGSEKAELAKAKHALRAEFKAARAAAVADYHAEMTAIRGEFLAAKAVVIADCRGHAADAPEEDSAGDDGNATGEDNSTAATNATAGTNATADANTTASEPLEPTSSHMTNLTKEEKVAWAHCVRDGLKPLKEEARAKIAEARAELKATLLEARQAALEEFRAEKQRVAAERGERKAAAKPGPAATGKGRSR